MRRQARRDDNVECEKMAWLVRDVDMMMMRMVLSHKGDLPVPGRDNRLMGKCPEFVALFSF